MHWKNLAVVLSAGLALATAARAADYQFDVLYSGAGNASLAAGSDDPTTTTLFDGDSFNWTIAAQNGDSWTVVTGGDFFPLMAFGVDEEGQRTADFTLELRLGGAPVYTLASNTVGQSYVHMGTDTVTLSTGLQFDHMALSYSLITAIEHEDYAVDPNNLQPIGSSPNGLLPIFGAPEMNQYSPGIVYAQPVPEPATAVLLAAGLAAAAGLARRRRERLTA